MTPKRLLRLVHYWLSLVIFIPCGIMFFAGIFLMLKKEVDWIQPPTQRGTVSQDMPNISYPQILAAAQSRPQAGINTWSDIDKIDTRPSKGIAKIISKTGWEVQIDTSTAQVLSTNYRRSDLIESLHDGSYFANWTKLYLFFPIGILLIIMWGTGIYLFIITETQKIRKRRRQNRKNKP
ncbi:MAG: PepSY-associated TM helix domain-containing protein [Litorimonas sp.]